MEAEDKQKKSESQKQEADAHGIVETVSNDEVSGRLMKYITDEDFTKIDEDYYQHAVVIHEEQIQEEVIYVSMQQVTHEGRTHQLQRREKARREREDEDEDQTRTSELIGSRLQLTDSNQAKPVQRIFFDTKIRGQISKTSDVVWCVRAS